MAYKDRNVFDKPGQYTLQTKEIISYRRDSETIAFKDGILRVYCLTL